MDEPRTFRSIFTSAGFWIGLAVALAVLWALEAYVPAYASITGAWKFVIEVLIIIIVSNAAEWIYKKIKR